MGDKASYHEQVKIRNILKLREMEKKLPSFCAIFFRGINDRVSTRTLVSYAYDLVIFFNYINENILDNAYENICDMKLDVLEKVEKFDLENYVSNAYGSVNFEYFVNTPGTYRGSYSNEDYSGRKISVKVDDEKDPGTLYYSSNYKSEIDVLSINEMVPSRVAMTISLGTGYNVVRSLEFDFDGAVSDDKASQIKERFIAAIGETKGLEVDKCKNDKETFTVILESDADASVEPGLWKEAFGCSRGFAARPSRPYR